MDPNKLSTQPENPIPLKIGLVAREGTTTVFFHGEKYADIPYAAGEKHGVERRYRDGSEIVQEVSWYNGQQHGPSVTYVDEEPAKTEWYY